ncbi:MAG: HlyD family efflux transporter periplasmic adaptor subunit [Acidobacteriota bacterium]
MDRVVSPGKRRRRIIRASLVAASLVAAAVTALAFLSGLIGTGLARDRVRTARVDTGPIEASISTSGVVEPEFEHVVTSPVDTRVLRIVKRPGEQVRAGDVFVELDISQVRLDLEKLDQQVQLKLNQLARARLDLDEALITLERQLEIKKLELEAQRTNTGRMRSLLQEGLVAQTVVDQAVVEEKKTAVEQEQLEQTIANARASTQAELAGLDMEMAILRKERDEARRQLDLASTVSDRDGVLTWALQEEGAAVRSGDVIARIADLTRFRIRADVSYVHSAKLAQGLPVIIRINETQLTGTTRQILPTITNGIISVLVGLDEPAHVLLKPNLRVEVEIVVARKSRGLRLKRGPGVDSEGRREMFVVHGDRAVKTPVELGVAGYDHCEVISGLSEGDEVIISDMASYMDRKEIALR